MSTLRDHADGDVAALKMLKQGIGFVGCPGMRQVNADSLPTSAKFMNRQKILVVDDDKVILHLLRYKLKAAGYEVFTAVDPSEAVTVARSAAPDLFILDISFPPDPTFNWDGFGVADWLRHIGLAWDKPVLFITADSIQKHQAHADRFQPSMLFQKPLNIEQLLATIAECLPAVNQPVE